jgi:hypothetical protein
MNREHEITAQNQICESGEVMALAVFQTVTAQRDALIDALREIAAYPVNVDGYNSASAIRLRMVATQTMARNAIKAIEA